MTKMAATISLCILSTLGTSMLLGCSGDDGSTENVKQMAGAGQGGAKAPLYGLAGSAGKASAGATSGGGVGGVAAGGASAGASVAGTAGAAAGIPNPAGAPEGGRDSIGFGGGGSGTVIRTDHESGGSGGLGAGVNLGQGGEDDGSWFGFGGLGGTGFWIN
jgi:fibronectin-binding autotransporter adhesin